MKFQTIILLIILSSLKMAAQPMFKVGETPRYTFNKEIVQQPGKKYYRIKFFNRTSISYRIDFSKARFDTLKAIEKLLSFKNDVRLCSIPVTEYNPARSQIYMGAYKEYSIQVEALFIINQLICRHPFRYSSIPVLVDKITGEEASISGNIVRRAFQEYTAWFEKIKSGKGDGLQNSSSMPLDNSTIRWY